MASLGKPTGPTRTCDECTAEMTHLADLPAYQGRDSACRASLPLDTPIRKLEAALKCRSCKDGRYAPLDVHAVRSAQVSQRLHVRAPRGCRRSGLPSPRLSSRRGHSLARRRHAPISR